jgi:hypothetical protein
MHHIDNLKAVKLVVNAIRALSPAISFCVEDTFCVDTDENPGTQN